MTQRQGSVRPASFVDIDPSDPAGAPASTETHLAVVLFAGRRAYKLYKPLDVGFIDASTVERRLELCRREVEINRRFAPDVYLGVMHLDDDDGVAHDHAVVMRRLDPSRKLARLVDTDEGPACIREVAKTVASLHASAPRLDEEAARDAAGVEALRKNWADNFAVLEPYAGRAFSAEDLERVRTLVTRFLDGRNALFEQRIASGMIVDGHGDLLAEDIFCLPDGPRILDCLAFDDRLRHGDVLADLGFLAMDIERLGGIEKALAFMGWYHEYTFEQHPGSLAHHYVAYRANVRAKVSALRHRQGEPSALEAVTDHHRRCLAHLERARVRFVLVGGTPATGKSTLATALGQAAGWTVLRTDEIRRELEGRPASVQPGEAAGATEAFGAGRYRPEAVDAVYDAVLGRARRLAGLGHSVILDASWIDAERRAAARAVAAEAGAEVVEICCDAPPDLVRRRLEQRRSEGTDPSEATVEVDTAMRALLDPWPEALRLDTSGPVEHVVKGAIERAR